MTKTDFIHLLEQRLMVLNDDERADLLSEYEQHIEMKMQSGLSEEEAIADFGDPEELIKELLEAYHLNTEYQQSHTFSSRMTHYVKSCANFLSSTFESLCQMNKKTLFQLSLRVCGLLIFLTVLYMFGALFCSILRSFLVYTLPFGQSIGHFFYAIIELCMYLIFMAFAVYLFVFFIKRYVLIDYQPLDPPSYTGNDSHTMEHLQNYAAGAKEQTSAVIARIRQKTSNSIQLYDKEASDRQQREFKLPFPDISLSDICMKILIWCCRFVGFFFLLFAACTALGLLAGTATALIFVIMGYGIIGPFMIVLGCTLLSVVVTALLFQFVFGVGGAKA